MKKILLTLVGVICSLGVWADDAISCSAYPTETAGTVTATNCVLKYFSAEGANASNVPAINAKVNNDANFFELTLNQTVGSTTYKTFKAGDVITVYLYGKKESCKIGSTSKTVVTAPTSTSEAAVQQEYTLTANDIESNGTIRIYRNSSNTHFAGVSVTGTRTLSNLSASDLTLKSSASILLNISATSQISTTSSSDGNITYTTSDKNVATVSTSGLITAVAGGTAVITVKQAETSTYEEASKTVTVTVPYAADAESETLILDNNNYGFSSGDNKTYYFKNGVILTNTGGKTYGYATIDNNNGMKCSANTTYTIVLPDGITVYSAKVKARSNYGNDKAAAQLGTMFGKTLTEDLPFSSEEAIEESFEFESGVTGSELSFTPAGNQVQMIIELSTVPTKTASNLVINEETIEVAKGKTATVAFTTSSTVAVTATSDKVGVATAVVDGNNIVITGVAAGTATITVSQASDETYAAGEKTITVTVTDPTADVVVYNWNTVGTTTLGGAEIDGGANATTGTVKIKNVSTNGVKFPNGLNKPCYMKIESKNGGFKVGDVVTWTGCINNATAGKDGAIMIVSNAIDGNVQLACSEIFNNTNTTTVEATTGSFTLTEDAECLYIGRAVSGLSSATATWLTQLTVSRAATMAEPALNADGFATFSCAYPVKISGAKVYVATLDAAAGKINATQVESGEVPAGTGVILTGEYSKTATASYCADAADINTKNDLKATTLADGSLAAKVSSLVLSGNTFKNFVGAAFAHGKAYFKYSSLGDGGSEDAKAFTIVFEDINNTATGINAVETSAKKAVKTVKNGKLVINVNGVEYNAVGAQIK